MTAFLPLEQLPTDAPLETRRDQWGRYLVVPPAGGKPTGYTRATTVAKVLDDGGGLIPWKATLAMTGLMRRPGLRARFEALYSRHPEAGPWYGSPEAKTEAKKLVEECAEAGGSSDRADVGTALHAIVEQHNRGQVPTITQESTLADFRAYVSTIQAAGITFDPRTIELTLIHDAWKVAGTADMGVARVPGLGDVIADLKTGTNLEYSWRSIAVQLAIYANADCAYRQGMASDGSEDRRYAIQPVSRDWAVVIHVPAGEGRCQLYKVNIAAGWEAFERSMWVRTWRTRKDLVTPITVAPALANDVVFLEAPAATHPMLEPLRTVLLERVLKLPAERQQILRDSWPPELPPLKRPEHWTPELIEQASRIIGAVASVEDSPGAAQQATSSPDVKVVAPGDTAGESAANTGAADTPPYLSVDEWNALPRDEQDRRRLAGHLPPELRVDQDILDGIKARLLELPLDLQEWINTQVPDSVPHLSLGRMWLAEHVEAVTPIIDAAHAQLIARNAGPDWTALCKTAGVTKAATMRKAAELAKTLEVSCPSTIQRITSGPLCDALVTWLEGTAEAKGTAA